VAKKKRRKIFFLDFVTCPKEKLETNQYSICFTEGKKKEGRKDLW
jgi:hypothetical protein